MNDKQKRMKTDQNSSEKKKSGGRFKSPGASKRADNKKGNGTRLWQEGLAWTVLGASFLMLALLNIFYLENWLDSDMAAEMVFSRLLADEGGFLATSGWYYSTEFRVLYTQLFMEPLFLIFRDWHVVRAVTNVLTYIVLLWSYFYMIKPLKVKKSTSLFTAAILLLPISETVVTHVQMGNTYMPHMIILFFGFGMFLRLTGRKFEMALGKMTLAGCYLLLSLVCGLSGVRYMLALQAPLVLTAVVYTVKSGEWNAYRREMTKANRKKLFGDERLQYLVFSILGALGALAGYALNVAVVARKYDFQTYDATNFISVYQGIFLERLQNTLGSLLMLFGYIPDKGFLSVRGMITMIAFVLLAGIVFILVRCSKELHSDGDRKGEISQRRFLLWFFVTAFVLNTFVFVFTTSTIVPRYYITVFMFAVPLLAVFYEEERLPLDRYLVTALLWCCLVPAAGKTVYSYISTDKNEEKHAVASFLQQEDYDFGYATYWNANIMTELTNGEVEVANLKDPEELSFFHWSSPKKYYEEGYHQGRAFLLLTREEASEYAGTPVVLGGRTVYQDEHYVVYDYESVADFLSCGPAADNHDTGGNH